MERITYKNQGDGDPGPSTITYLFVDQSSGGSRQVDGLGAGQTASLDINCQTGHLNVTIAQNAGAPVPEVNTANNSASVVITGNPTC